MEKKYVVKVFSLFSNFIETNATDEKEALKKVKNVLFSEKTDDDTKLNYEGTLPETHWLVLSEEDLEKLKDSSKETTEEISEPETEKEI